VLGTNGRYDYAVGGRADRKYVDNIYNYNSDTKEYTLMAKRDSAGNMAVFYAAGKDGPAKVKVISPEGKVVKEMNAKAGVAEYGLLKKCTPPNTGGKLSYATKDDYEGIFTRYEHMIKWG